jgi:hypothetical protein
MVRPVQDVWRWWRAAGGRKHETVSKQKLPAKSTPHISGRRPPRATRPAGQSAHTPAQNAAPKPPQKPGHKPGPKTTRERQAAQRALAAASGARSARRRRMLNVFAPIAAVVVVLTVLVAVKVGTDAGGPKSGTKATAAEAAVIAELTGVPAATLDAVGKGTVTAYPNTIDGAALVADGKPRVLYIGAEYCPYCAVQRWPVIVALSRFGTWSNLDQTTSAAAPEVYPKTSTFSFHGAKYTSDLLSFSGIETQTNQVVGSGYGPLDTLAAADEAIMRKYDTSGGIPFLDLGGKYAFTGSMYKPELIAGKSHAQIAAALANPDSAIAKGVDGSANVLTAILCAQTGNKPAAVCTSAGVTKANEALRNAG